MQQRVIITITGAGHYSTEVMDGHSAQVQKYLLEQENIQPRNVLVKFSTEYVAQVEFVPEKDEVPEHTVLKREVIVSANIPIATLKTKTDFKKFLDKLFGCYGTVVLTDPFETVQF